MAGLFGTGVNAPSIRQVQITPAGIPGSTYVRPQQREVGGNLRALADALGGLNSALQNYGSVMAQEGRDPNSEANRAFLDSIQGKSPEELRALAAQGGFNRIQADGLNTLLGSKMAHEFRQHLTEAYNTEFDQASGDFATWSEQKRQEWAAGLPDDASRAAFFRSTEQWTQQFGAKDLERKLTTAMAERDTAVIDEFRMIGDDMRQQGATPVEIADAIIRQSRLNRDFRMLDGRAQNETLFQIATEYAARGEVEVVKALLGNPRGGIGPLSKTSEYSVKSLGLIEQAEAQQAKQAGDESYNVRVYIDEKIASGTLTQDEMRRLKEENPWITDAQAASWVDQSKNTRRNAAAKHEAETGRRALAAQSELAEQQVMAEAFATTERLGGAFHFKDVEVPSASGTGTRTISAEAQKNHVIERKLAQFADLRERLVADGVPEAEVEQRLTQAKLAWFDGNGLINPEWDKPLNSMNVLSSIARVAEKGAEAAGKLGEWAETYRLIDAANPGYAAKLISDERARDFFESYSAAVEDGADQQEALLTAARVANSSPMQRAASVLPLKEAEKLAQDILNDDNWMWQSAVEPSTANTAFVQEEVQKLMRRGMAKERAVERVKKNLQERSVNINGVLVMGHRDLPKDFEDLAHRMLEDVFEEWGAREGLTDASDLYIQPVEGESRWIILRKEDGLPLGGGVFITPRGLQTYREKLASDTSAAAADKTLKARVKADARREGLKRVWGTDNTWRKVGPKGHITEYEAVPDPKGGPTIFKPIK